MVMVAGYRVRKEVEAARKVRISEKDKSAKADPAGVRMLEKTPREDKIGFFVRKASRSRGFDEIQYMLLPIAVALQFFLTLLIKNE